MQPTIRRLAPGRTIDEFLGALSDGRELYALESDEDGNYHLVRAEQWRADRHTLGAYRPVEPLKSVFTQPREFLGETMGSGETPRLPERIVIGVKNCDLSGLAIQDHVFQGLPPADPHYTEAREKTVLVSCDCTDCLDACFCPVVGERPYAEQGYDINISPLTDDYLIESGERKRRVAASTT